MTKDEDNLNWSNRKFNLVSMLFLQCYLIYHRCYLGVIIISFTFGALAGILSCIPVLGSILAFIGWYYASAVYGDEFVRYFQRRKRNSLQLKRKSESEIENKLAPSWTPVIIYLIICFIFWLMAISFIIYAVMQLIEAGVI